MTRVFGTREEIQSDDYQSPIAGLYARAWDRYRQAERQRREGIDPADPSTLHSAYPALDIQPNNFHAQLGATNEEDEIIMHITELETGRNGGANLASQASSSADTREPANSPASYSEQSRAATNERISRRIAEIQFRDTRRPRTPNQDQPFDLPHMGLDSDNRPPPKTDVEMTVKLEC